MRLNSASFDDDANHALSVYADFCLRQLLKSDYLLPTLNPPKVVLPFFALSFNFCAM